MQRLKIGIVSLNYAPDHTGIAPYSTAVAEGLSGYGHDVRVITGYPHYPAWKIADGYTGRRIDEVIGDVPVRRLRHLVMGGTGTKGRIAMETSFAAHTMTESFRDLDVVLTVSPSLFTAASVVARCRGAHAPAVGLIVQDIYSAAVVEIGNRIGKIGFLVQGLESWTARHADGVVVINDRFRQHMGSRLDVADDKITTIPNWSHVGETITRAKRDRERFGWRDDETVVVHAGNMGMKQGLENVIDAGRIAAERGLPLRFVLLGDGNRRAALQAAGSGIPTVQFLPSLPDAEFGAALASADVLLVNEAPRVADMSLPSKLTTYFAMGRPIVAATNENSGTAAEIARSGAGRVIAPGDPDALVDVVMRFSDEVEVARFAAAGRRYRTANLAPELAIERYEAWARQLAATKHDLVHHDIESDLVAIAPVDERRQSSLGHAS